MGRDASALDELMQKLPVGVQRLQVGAGAWRRAAESLVRDDPAARTKQSSNPLERSDRITLMHQEKARICQVKWTPQSGDLQLVHIAYVDLHVVQTQCRDNRPRALYRWRVHVDADDGTAWSDQLGQRWQCATRAAATVQYTPAFADTGPAECASGCVAERLRQTKQAL